MMLLCLLCACGGKETSPLQAPMDFRVSLLQAGGCRVKLEGTADTSDRIWEFALEANLQTDGTADLTLIRPEGVAGITAHLEGASGRLGCEELSVEFGIPEDAENHGGLNLFGESFGDYPQALLMKMGYQIHR